MHLRNMAEEKALIDRLEAMDEAILAWAKQTRQELIRTLLRMGVQDRIELAKRVSRIKYVKTKSGARVQKDPFLTQSIAYRIRRNQQEIESVGFSFARHGIFLERGVGKGRPAGSGAAEKARKPWLSQVIPASVDQLADIIAEEYADIAALALRISIPGVINTTVAASRNARNNKFQQGIDNSMADALQRDINNLSR